MRLLGKKDIDILLNLKDFWQLLTLKHDKRLGINPVQLILHREYEGAYGLLPVKPFLIYTHCTLYIPQCSLWCRYYNCSNSALYSLVQCPFPKCQDKGRDSSPPADCSYVFTQRKEGEFQFSTFKGPFIYKYSQQTVTFSPFFKISNRFFLTNLKKHEF